MQIELMRRPRGLLQKKCKSMKISAQGSKSDIVERILNHLSDNPPGNAPINIAAVAPDRATSQRRSRAQLERRMRYNPTTDPRIGRRTKTKVRAIKKKKSRPSTSKSDASTSKSRPRAPTKSSKVVKRQRNKVKKPNYLTLQFIGIHPLAQTQNIEYPLGTQSNVTSLIIKTKLTTKSTISELKVLLRKTCAIPRECDILILFSHIIISRNGSAKLKEFGITNHSLLTVAITDFRRVEYHRVHSHRHISRSISSTKQMLRKGAVTGLDIITQETGVDLYRMPVCGHLMSRESLYHFACSTFMDPSSEYIRCPHSKSTLIGSKNRDKWSCSQCTYLNEAILRCGKRKTRCSMCGHQRIEDTVPTNQCGAVWHYSLIKRILIHDSNSTVNAIDAEDRKESFDDFDFSKLEALSARNTLQSANGKRFNLQKCGKCHTVHLKNRKSPQRREDDADLKTKCVLCDAHFCWNCSRQIGEDEEHFCDSDQSSQFAIGQILSECPPKRIGTVSNVPSVRACVNPDCGQLITHSEACKHMKCASCKLNFCFVCLRPKEGNNWQCGSYDTQCPVAPRQTLQSLSWNIVTQNVILPKSFQLF